MLRSEAFIEAFKKELDKRMYIYIEPMNKSGEWAEIHYVFSRPDKELRVAKVYKEPVGLTNKDIYVNDIQKLASFKHNNIAEIYDKGFIEYNGDEYFFLILEHIKGKSLEEIDTRVFLDRPINERIRFFLQTLEGVNTFRDNFEFHNDLHFGNIMLSEEIKIKEKIIKIIDPGSSKYSYKPGEEDFDLYSIKEGLLDFFFKREEMSKIGGGIDLKSVSFSELKKIIKTELQKEHDERAEEDIIEDCLRAVENIINFYFDNFNETNQRTIDNIAIERRKEILSDVQTLNIYKETANEMGIVISGDWNSEKYARGEEHEIYITIKDIIIKIVQHEYGEVKKMTLKLGSNLVFERELIEKQLESVIGYKDKKIKNLLIYFMEKIHHNYPFEDVIVRYMDSSYYSYINQRHWNKAKEQIIYKINIEFRTINDIKVKLALIKNFLTLKDKIEISSNNKISFVDEYAISAKELAREFRRGSVDYRNNLLNEIKRQLVNLDFISINIVSLLSWRGIFLFLTDGQIRQAVELSNHFRQYKNERIRASLNINLKESRDFELEDLEQAINILYNRIDSERLDEINDFLNGIKAYLVKIQKDLS